MDGCAQANSDRLLISHLPLPSTFRYDRVIRRDNTTHVRHKAESLIHKLFEAQVVRTPNAVALECGNQTMTFEELNVRANQLAHYLKSTGSGPDRLIAVCVERGLDMVVCLLGVLKAGGAYVPLDPRYPVERLRYMLVDSNPVALITESRLTGAFADTSTRVITLDQVHEQFVSGPANNLDASAAMSLVGDNLAYVIYTSGSTGKPKGVMVSHAGVTNFLQSMQREPGINADDRLLAVTTVCFDIAALEIYLPLVSGATLVLASRESAADAQALMRILEESRISILQATPATWQLLLGAGWKGRKTLKALCGGEALTADLSRELLARVGALWNLYGPTETTIWSSVRQVAVPEGRGVVEPIGGPIANTQIYILDPQLQPVPMGVEGEIYIGGAGLARGYFNRPELTAERFIADPFRAHPLARIYKTGDLGRWRSDGVIEYLGRNDHQVKIRGFRIETGEIEAQLVRHAQVNHAVVIAREDVLGDKRLVAYVTHPNEGTVSTEELRAHLAAALPEHMVPSAIISLDRLPLTPNGKLDRRALPAPQQGAYVSREYEPPQGETEQLLADIWQALLRIDRVGRNDNFFQLGGHSLLVAEVAQRLNKHGFSATTRDLFESRTLADLSHRLTSVRVDSEITPQMMQLVSLQPEHLERIVQAVAGGAPNVQDVYPLSPLQEGILFHHRLNEHGGDTYVLPILLSANSRNQLDRFVNALQRVVNRHDALRTAILWDALPQPVQVVYRHVEVSVEELEGAPGVDPIGKLHELMMPGQLRLQMQKAPLIELVISQRPSSSDWYALLRIHHIICDNHSIETILAEIRAFMEERGHELKNPVPYREHVFHALTHARSRNAEEFFRKKLQSVEEPTAPFGLLDVRGDASHRQQARQSLSPSVAARIRAKASRLGMSPATLFHACWALVVSRTSNRDDVVFGTVLMGRQQSHATDGQSVGMFINTLPMRISLRGVSVRDLVLHTQREVVELLDYEQASLAVAQRCSSVDGAVPLFSSILNYLHIEAKNSGDCAEFAPGIKVLASKEWTNYPIVLYVEDTGDEFVLAVQTDDRIDPNKIVSFVDTAMTSLLNGLDDVESPPALSICVLSEQERDRVVIDFNATYRAHPRDMPVHELFEQQVQRTPNTVALTSGSQALSYSELDSRANELARYLRVRGVGPDRLVALCVERSVELVVSMLAVLKTGAAYVPMDPSYPVERLQYMLEDSAAHVMVTQEKFKEYFSTSKTDLIALDTERDSIARLGLQEPDSIGPKQSSDTLAYVIYTSGSTGKPKGVMVSHAGVTNFLQSMQREPGINADDRLLAVTTVCFDIAALEIYLPLVNGATLVLASRESAADAQALMRILEESRISILQATPATWQLLLGAGWKGRKTLKTLCGGEALTAELSRELLARVGALWNLYGPTETTIWSSVRQVSATEGRGVVEPIGGPIANTQIYILDPQLQPVPMGVEGEIYIGGAGLARGYFNRPELTAERFIADPFRANPLARIYKTGDLGRWRSDGVIEYLGRNDHQVKIRGFRIETGEIEAQLVRHAQVNQAVVIAREDVLGDKRLVAYVTHPNEGTVSTEELRAHLAAALPEHMVPSAIISLDQLPLTPNGKLDRRALPAPQQGAYVSREYEPPQGETEELLADIWQALLRIDRVGRNDNFFQLGGHSLLAMQAIVRAQTLLTIEIPVGAFFDYPTLRGHAVFVEERRRLRLQETVSRDTDDIGDLLEKLTSMPESRVESMLQELKERMP